MNNILSGFILELEKFATEIKLYDSQTAYNLSRLNKGIVSSHLDAVKKGYMKPADANKVVRQLANKPDYQKSLGYHDPINKRIGINAKGVERAQQTGYPASIKSTIAHEKFHSIPVIGHMPIVGELGARVTEGMATKGGIMTKLKNTGTMVGRGFKLWRKYV